jgi:hypothetical protein
MQTECHTLEERRAMGLPDEGCEKEVMGGIGLEPDDRDDGHR